MKEKNVRTNKVSFLVDREPRKRVFSRNNEMPLKRHDAFVPVQEDNGVTVFNEALSRRRASCASTEIVCYKVNKNRRSLYR